MPAMANITVLNAAAGNVVYTGSVPSAGDKSPARWNALALSTIAGFRPYFTMVTRDNGTKTARQNDFSYYFPVVETIGGVAVVNHKAVGSASFLTPSLVDASVPYDAYVQFGNLLVSALVRSAVSDGYAPT